MLLEGLHNHVYRPTQPRFRLIAARGDLLEGGDHLRHATVDGFVKDGVLVLEVVVDRRAVDACFLRDRIDGRSAESMTLKYWSGCPQDALALRAVLLAVLAQRLSALVCEGRRRFRLLRHHRHLVVRWSLVCDTP